MTVINPPQPLPASAVEWEVVDPAQVNRSSWTGRRKVIGLPGAAYRTAKVTMVAIHGEARFYAWRAWLTALRGPKNSFPLRAGEVAQTTIANPTVAAGASDGNAVPLTGLPASTTVLVAGQHLSVALPSGHQRLACLTQDLISDAGGHAVAAVDIELGEIPLAGAAVEIVWPYALMALTGNAKWSVGRGQTYSISLDCEEAL